MARRRRSKHTGKQKEAARKRGPSYLRKGVELGQKANIIAGGFYEEPTHNHWCVGFHVPEGRDLPNLETIFRSQVEVQQVPYELRSGKRGTTVIVSGRPSARVKPNNSEPLSRGEAATESTSRTSTPSLLGDDMETGACQTVNESERSNSFDEDFLDLPDDIIPPGNTVEVDMNERSSLDGNSDGCQQEMIGIMAPMSPTHSIHVAELTNDVDDEQLSIQGEDLVNWSGCETEKDAQTRGNCPKDIPHKQETSGSSANCSREREKCYEKRRLAAAAKRAAAMRLYASVLRLEDWWSTYG